MGNSRIEILVGCLMAIGFLAFGWLALQLGEVPWLTGARSYPLKAEFSNISGIKSGADVQIAGVSVGKVRDIYLSADNLAEIVMYIDNGIKVPTDSMVSVKSQGIIGDKYIQISLGADSAMYKAGDVILDTESSLDLESLISKFAFGEVGQQK